MTVNCPYCTSSSSKNGSFSSGGIVTQRYKCKTCYKTFSVGGATPTKRYVITTVVEGSKLNLDLLACIKDYANKKSAEIIFLTSKHRFVSPDSVIGFPEEAEAFIRQDTITFETHKVKILGSLHLLASIENPLSGLDPISKGYSLIVGHPQVQLRTMPRSHEEYPAIITTTGSVSDTVYPDTKQGTKSTFNHALSAMVLELGAGAEFFVRHLNYDEKTKCFYDLDEVFSVDGIEKQDATALVTGDEHVFHLDKIVSKATYTDPDSLVNILKPRFIVRHDVFDGHSISHHHEKDTILKYQKYIHGDNDVEAELNKTVSFINKTTPHNSISLIVQSNHNEHLQKWLNTCDPKVEPWNAKLYHELMFKTMQAICKATLNDSKEIPDTFELYAKDHLNQNVMFVDRNAGMSIHGITIGAHGDVGVNGSRGSRKQFSMLPTKTIIGHSHSPGIEKGCFQTGTSSKLRLEYNKGPSSWHHAHCIIHANGKRQLIFIRNGKYKA